MHEPAQLTAIVSLSLTIFFLCIVAFIYNQLVTHYLGIDYSPPNTFIVGVLLLLMSRGFNIIFGKNSKVTMMQHDVMLLYLVMSIIALATNAVQYTPFAPIDQTLINWQDGLIWDNLALLNWITQYPQLHQLLCFIYDSLTTQMTILPLCLILSGKTKLFREYCILLLLTCLLGFSFYYFFPTIAPASMLNNVYFTPEQHATGIKFHQIHQGAMPTTSDGGLIAFPSFHVIWAWLCVRITREWPRLYLGMTLFNLVLCFACVVLGWHYPIDVIGSLVCMVIACAVHRALMTPSHHPRLFAGIRV